MPTLFTRLVRAALLALALVVIGTAIVLSRDWLEALSVPLLFAGNGTTVLLVTILAIYLALLVAAAFGVVVLGWLVWRSQRNNRPSPGSRLRLTRARWLLLSASIVCGLMMAEAAAAAWLSWTHRLPAWPRPSAASRPMGNEVLIVVIGESSRPGRALRRLALSWRNCWSRASEGDTGAPVSGRGNGRERRDPGNDAP